MKRAIILFTLATLLILAGGALTMSSANYRLDWFIPLTGGGGPASSDHYAVNLTVGQTAIDASSSINYDIGLGFWRGATGVRYRIYLPLIVREDGI